MDNTQKMIIFVLSNKKTSNMKKEITEKENDLIETIRNYRRAYPNGAEQFEKEIIAMVYDLMDERD